MHKSETVLLKNNGKDILSLDSISSSSIHFYVSFASNNKVSNFKSSKFYFLSTDLRILYFKKGHSFRG